MLLVSRHDERGNCRRERTARIHTTHGMHVARGAVFGKRGLLCAAHDISNVGSIAQHMRARHSAGAIGRGGKGWHARTLHCERERCLAIH